MSSLRSITDGGDQGGGFGVLGFKGEGQAWRREMSKDKYADFVDHPRYGPRPNLTGLNPQQFEKGVHLHWNGARGERIPNTAIEADLSRQTPTTAGITHYFDETRRCENCNRPFIFFAEEQKFWYEELGFNLNADCVRCFPCRQRQRTRTCYEVLFAKADKNADEHLEMAELCLTFIEARTFTVKQLPHVRRLLNLAKL